MTAIWKLKLCWKSSVNKGLSSVRRFEKWMPESILYPTGPSQEREGAKSVSDEEIKTDWKPVKENTKPSIVERKINNEELNGNGSCKPMIGTCILNIFKSKK